jgi:hypothetical protein
MKRLKAPKNDLLPPLTPEDEKFAIELANEYKLPFDDLSWLIGEFRESIRMDPSELYIDQIENLAIYKEYEHILID